MFSISSGNNFQVMNVQSRYGQPFMTSGLHEIWLIISWATPLKKIKAISRLRYVSLFHWRRRCICFRNVIFIFEKRLSMCPRSCFLVPSSRSHFLLLSLSSRFLLTRPRFSSCRNVDNIHSFLKWKALSLFIIINQILVTFCKIQEQ